VCGKLIGILKRPDDAMDIGVGEWEENWMRRGRMKLALLMWYGI